jgi:hypothetical protein
VKSKKFHIVLASKNEIRVYEWDLKDNKFDEDIYYST